MVSLSEPENVVACKTVDFNLDKSNSVVEDLGLILGKDKPAYELFSEAQNSGFSPVITDFGYSKPDSFSLQKVTGFNMRPYGSYYNVMRVGYNVLQAITPAATALIANAILRKTEDDVDKGPQVSNSVLHSQNPASPPYFKSKLSKDPHALDSFYKAEAVLVTAVSMLMTCAEFKGKVEDFALSIGAEIGKDKEDVEISDLFHSKNPIIKIERDRMLWKSVTRLCGGAFFVGGLMPGLIASSVALGAERTIYYADSPYDILSKAVNEVSFGHLTGEVAKENLVSAFQKAMQGMYADRDRNTITPEEMQELKPTLLKVADDIIKKRIGIESIYGILGGGIIVVGNPELSESNYDFVSKNMLEGVIKVAKQKKMDNNTFDNKQTPWLYQFKEGVEQEHNPELASSAHRDYVEQQRSRISENQFQNYVI